VGAWRLNDRAAAGKGDPLEERPAPAHPRASALRRADSAAMAFANVSTVMARGSGMHSASPAALIAKRWRSRLRR